MGRVGLKPLQAILSVLLVFFVTNSVSAAILYPKGSCVRDLTSANMNIKQVQEYITEEGVVSQCEGTCYFESALGAINEKLKNATGFDLEINRVELFKALTADRLKQFFAATGFEVFGTKVRNILDGGTADEIGRVFNNYPVLLQHKVTGQRRVIESMQIQNVFYEHEQLLEDMAKTYNKLRLKIQLFLELHAEELMEELRQLNQRDDLYHEERVILTNSVLALEFYMAAGETDPERMLLTLQDLEDLKLEPSVKLADFIERVNALYVERLEFDKLTRNKVSETFRVEFPSTEDEHLSKVETVVNTKLQIKTQRSKFTVDSALDALDSGSSVVLSFRYFELEVVDEEEKQGLLDYNGSFNSPGTDINKPETHASILEAYYFDLELDQFVFLVRNSHGTQSGHKGYLLITQDYLEEFGIEFTEVKLVKKQ